MGGSYPHTKSTPEITERHPRTWVTRVIHTRPPPEGWSKAVGELKVDVSTKLYYPMCLQQLEFLESRVIQNENFGRY